MDKNTAYVLIMFMFWGWIPILATGIALAGIIDQIKNFKRSK